MTAESRIALRSGLVLDYLVKHGRSAITAIAMALVIACHLVRYALRTLREEHRAHIESFDLVMGEDGIPRYTAMYVAGKGRDAVLPFSDLEPELDWEVGGHLQPIYMQWSATRTPDYPTE